ncbi:MAG: YidC/Oxa1 family membrane protein insertase [Clostridia bacterium]|nr:YidC/Oxa1 family membrane protein insertase [Clostridia bacterium]
MGAIAGVLGQIMEFLYNFVQNYGVAIFLFTLIVRIILLPLNIKQQKSMIKMQKINPLLTELQTKYKNDKEKQNQETMKLYKKYKISPMSGCFPMLIQFPILIALIWVIYDPGWYMFHIDTAKEIAAHPEIYEGMSTQLAKLQVAVNSGLNAKIFGINLVAIPDFKAVSELWIFPLVATGLTYLSGKITQGQQPSQAANDQAAQTGKMMTTIFPLMTLFFTFTMPVAASFYWTISSAFQILQTLALKKLIKVDDIELDNGGTWHERNGKKR